MATGLYGYACGAGLDNGIFRLGGVGLGNLLFSWARCAVFCRANGATQLYTTWPQFKPGSWIRWEPDKRHYCGLFHPLSDEVHGAAKLRVLYSLPRIKEDEWSSGFADSRRIVEFHGLKNFFRDIPAKDHLWLKDRFLGGLRDAHLWRTQHKPDIGVHIRLGDKPAYTSRAATATNLQLPIAWYSHVIQRVSAELNVTGEIGVCSDASEKQLAEVLRLPNVRLVRGRTAVHDLMYLANCRLIVGSCSTFSQWAAFLSGGPSIWHPAHDRKGGLSNGSLELLMSSDCVPDRTAWRRCMDQAFGRQVQSA